MAKFGASNLSDAELLHLLIGSGNKQVSAEEISKQILKLLKDKGSSVTYSELSNIKGMGAAKTSEIIALFELGRRYLMPADRPVISNTDEAVAQLGNIRDKKQDYVTYIGDEREVKKAREGYKVDTFLVTKRSDGMEISRTKITTDIYPAQPAEVYTGVVEREQEWW